MEKNCVWDFFENIYDNNIKKGQTFSFEMGEEIKKELERLNKERNEWLKNKEKELDSV